MNLNAGAFKLYRESRGSYDPTAFRPRKFEQLSANMHYQEQKTVMKKCVEVLLNTNPMGYAESTCLQALDQLFNSPNFNHPDPVTYLVNQGIQGPYRGIYEGYDQPKFHKRIAAIRRII